MMGRMILGMVGLTAVLAAGAVRADDTDRGPAIGSVAPELSLEDVTDGTVHTLAEQRGERPVVLVFFRGAW